MSWRRHAACRGADTAVFFAVASDERATALATALCGSCPVAADCLAEAVEGGERGIWGGLTERQRAELLADTGDDGVLARRLRHREGWEWPDIAEVLGVSVSKAQFLAYRAYLRGAA